MSSMSRSRPHELRVLVCRGCCCGTARKHPTTDHGAQVASLEAAAAQHGSVAVVDCLGRCDRSNVIVVKRSRHRAFWIGPVLDHETTTAVGDWLRDGAPDPPPPAVNALVFDRHDPPTPVALGRAIEVRR